MDGSIFFFAGGALVLAALVISYIGIRGKDSFPAGRGAMTGSIAVFAVLVVGTAAYAVANAREEEQHRLDQAAEEQAAAAEEVAAGEQDAAAPPEAPAEVLTLDLTSPADGSLSFEPDSLQAGPGTITLAYENPSPVPHNVAIGDDEEQLLDESETVSESLTEATAELVPGEYFYFCTVAGHREAGMEGVLTVQ